MATFQSHSDRKTTTTNTLKSTTKTNDWWSANEYSQACKSFWSTIIATRSTTRTARSSFLSSPSKRLRSRPFFLSFTTTTADNTTTKNELLLFEITIRDFKLLYFINVIFIFLTILNFNQHHFFDLFLKQKFCYKCLTL